MKRHPKRRNGHIIHDNRSNEHGKAAAKLRQEKVGRKATSRAERDPTAHEYAAHERSV